MRAFILVALLGGAALAGGLYFGGGMSDGGNAAQDQQVEDVAATTPPSDQPADTLDEPVGVPLEDATSASPPARPERPVQTAARDEPPAPTRREEPTPPRPTPTVSAPTSTATSGGPVSLSPSEEPTTGTPSTIVPLTPPVQPPPTQTVPAATQRPATPVRTGDVVWAQRPSSRRVSDAYPDRAARQGVGGRVELSCVVQSTLGVSCSVASETPTGMGFGRAALTVAGSYRAATALSNGASAVGARTRIVVQFQAPSR